MSACLRCPSDIPDGARFCPSCGTPISLEEGVTRSRPHDGGRTPRAGSAGARASHSTPHLSSTIDHGRFLPGTIVAERYRVVALLGRGGMGEIYRADDLRVGQAVALKFLPARFASDPDRLARLLREVAAARQVAHPNVCRVHDVDEVDGEHFISMELVQGEDLASLLRRIGHLPADKALQIARQLCAGLGAAHARGLLHRDLKPANVMLDERGTVRIMDFGLAGAEFSGDAVREGTPAYMAPEQLAGRTVTVQSDIYALGLVLYELFTGRPAFTAGSPAEMLHAREHGSPTPPTRYVELDDATERAILRCLEREPALRPASALAVAAALPGGDPLAAALQAGETPSPDMVAAAGGEGALRPALAWTMAGAFVALVALMAAIWPASSDLGQSPLPRSADALTEQAHTVLGALGYPDAPGDEAAWFERNYGYVLHEANHPRPRRIIEPWPGASTFVYRRSPRGLTPYASPILSGDDPPLTLSGMVLVRLAPRGELLELVVVPPQYEEGAAPWPEPDWGAVLTQTGLDPARLAPAEPRWAPPVASDARRAWEGTPLPGRPPVRVEAAAYHGRVTYVSVLGPWSQPTRMPGVDLYGSHPVRLAITKVAPNVLVMVVLITAVGLARRNLRLGRGDRRGAGRVAAAVTVLAAAQFLFLIHHVADLGGEWRLFLMSAGFVLCQGAFIWLVYVALEPYVRRRWPDILIGWSRVLAGRVRDPLVGRDLLVGMLAGALLALSNHVINALPSWFTLPGQTPIPNDRWVLGGAVQLLGLTVGVVSGTITFALLILGLLFVARVLVRNGALAVALTALVLALLNLGGENFAVESIVAVLSGVAPALVLARYGLLALVAMNLTQRLLLQFPLGLDWGRWYGEASLFGFVLLAALVVYAFRTALGGRPAFTATPLED